MKKVTVFVLWAALSVTILSACGSRAPTDIAQNLIKALETQDSTGLDRVYCSSSLAELSRQSGVRIRFEGMVYTERNRHDSTVEVEVRGTARSGSSATNIFWQLKMKKKSGAWCVDSLQSVDPC
jgi:hypothetical protein